MEPTHEQMKIIQTVIERTANKYTFGYYEVDDIKQESFIICLEAIQSYDNSRPFENFIASHLSNRLKTLRRDKYSRKDLISEKHEKLNEVKKNLMDLKGTLYEICYEEDLVDVLSTDEALDKVLNELSPSMRNDFIRIANGVSVQTVKKKKVFDTVKEILGEDW